MTTNLKDKLNPNPNPNPNLKPLQWLNSSPVSTALLMTKLMYIVWRAIFWISRIYSCFCNKMLTPSGTYVT